MKAATPNIHTLNGAPGVTPPSGSLPWTWSLGEPLEFLRLLWAVAHALHSTSKRLEVTMGITGPQRLALQMVGRFPQITAGQLAQLLHVDPSTLTGIVQRLVRRGLIQRRPDAQDGRRTLLGLTALGRRFEASTRRPGKTGGTETAEAAVARALNNLRPAEIAAARRTLTALSAALGNTSKADSPVRATGAKARGARTVSKTRSAAKPTRAAAKKPSPRRHIGSPSQYAAARARRPGRS